MLVSASGGGGPGRVGGMKGCSMFVFGDKVHQKVNSMVQAIFKGSENFIGTISTGRSRGKMTSNFLEITAVLVGDGDSGKDTAQGGRMRGSIALKAVGGVITTGHTMVKTMTQATADIYSTISAATLRATTTNSGVDSVLVHDHSDSPDDAEAQHSTVTKINKFITLLPSHPVPATLRFSTSMQSRSDPEIPRSSASMHAHPVPATLRFSTSMQSRSDPEILRSSASMHAHPVPATLRFSASMQSTQVLGDAS